MTASPPKVNGHARPPAPPVLGDWQPIEATPAQAATPTTKPEAAPVEPEVDSDLVAQAKAEAIRAQAWADAEATRLAAEAEAKAVEIKAEEEARKLRLANDRAERKAREEAEASEARIAESRKRKADADRAREDADRQAEEKQQAEVEEQEKQQKSEKSWRRAAKSFYGMCQMVALPVQTHAFWMPSAPWLLVAPVMLESGALVVQRGARAAADDNRPYWHYRLISWLLAAIAASINLAHGLVAFDPATAISTAFASLAGPGVYDLYEHGRIRKREGALTRRERKAAEKAAKAEAAAKVAEEQQRAAEKEAADKVAEEARQKLAEERQREFPKVWAEAVKIGAALGKAPDDPAVWPRAYRNIEGCEPGESIESITARRTAEKRVESALSGTPVNTLSKTTNAQRAIQIKTSSRRSTYKPVPPTRKPGDTPPYHPAARRAHGETKRRLNASQNDRPNDN